MIYHLTHDTAYLKKLDVKFRKKIKCMIKQLMEFPECKRFKKYMRKKTEDDKFVPNFNSPQQVKQILFTYTRGFAYDTGDDILHDRKTKKLISNNTSQLPPLNHPRSC